MCLVIRSKILSFWSWSHNVTCHIVMIRVSTMVAVVAFFQTPEKREVEGSTGKEREKEGKEGKKEEKRGGKRRNKKKKWKKEKKEKKEKGEKKRYG